MSVLLYGRQLQLARHATRITQFAYFLPEFVGRLKWQTRLEAGFDPEYAELQTFQSAMTQASVEKSATKILHELLDTHFKEFEKSGRIRGDKEYERRTGRSATAASKP